MTTIVRGTPETLAVEWRAYAGGPYVAVTGVTIKVTNLAGTVILAQTSTGVTNPATGINAYTWTPSSGLTPADYLVTWSGTDPDAETVGATELVTVTDALIASLGGPYASVSQLKARMGIPDSNTTRDTDLATRLVSASTDVNRWCHRQFGRAETASVRKFFASGYGVDVHDFWSTDDLAITPYSDGLPGTAWDLTTVELFPQDGIRDQVPGWPYERIGYPYGTHPLTRALIRAGAEVRVTAKWGWASVPENVVTATLMLASMDDKAKDAPFGVAGFGDYAVRIRTNPMVEEKLKPYVKDGPGLEVGS